MHLTTGARLRDNGRKEGRKWELREESGRTSQIARLLVALLGSNQ